jgi:hypothetical protein
MFSRCDNDNKRPGPSKAEVIPVLHSVAEANASDESDGVAEQEDEQIGIFQILEHWVQWWGLICLVLTSNCGCDRLELLFSKASTMFKII